MVRSFSKLDMNHRMEHPIVAPNRKSPAKMGDTFMKICSLEIIAKHRTASAFKAITARAEDDRFVER